MAHKKTNNWVKYLFTPSVAVVSAAALLSGVVTPVAQAQTPPFQSSGNRDDGTLVPVTHQYYAPGHRFNYEWAYSRYKIESGQKVDVWPLLYDYNKDTAGADLSKRYDLLKDTGYNFSLELQQPEIIYNFRKANNADTDPEYLPSVQDGNRAGIALGAVADGPFAGLHQNCFMADGNDEGIDFANDVHAGQILHCKVTDENRAIVKIVFNPDPANPGQSLEPVWNPAIKFGKNAIKSNDYLTAFEFRVKTIDGVPAVNSGRDFGAFDSSRNPGRLGVYKTSQGVEIRVKRDSIRSQDIVNGVWNQATHEANDGGTSISGAVKTIEVELMPIIYALRDSNKQLGTTQTEPNANTAFSVQLPAADLVIDKTGPAIAGLGDTISWKVTVTKNGTATGPSHGYVVADELPDFVDLSTVKVTEAQYAHTGTANATDVTLAQPVEIDGKQILEIKRVAPGYSIERRDSQGGGLQSYITADQGTNTLVSPPVVLGSNENDVYTITAKVRSDIDPAVIKKHENFVTVSGADVDYRQGIPDSKRATQTKESNSHRAVTQIAGNAITYKLQSDGDVASRTQNSTDKDGAVAGSPAGVNVDAGRSIQEMFTSTDLTGAIFKLINPETQAKVESYTLAGKGTYRIAADGVITFETEPNYAGAVPVATAIVTTAAGDTATAKYQPVVVPVVKDLSGVGTIDREAVTVALDAANSEIDPETVKFSDADKPAGATVSEDGRTLTVPGEGTWTVDKLTGEMTFTPLASFTGDPTPVKYVAAAKDALADGTKISTITPGTVTVTYPAVLPKVEKFAVPGEPITGIEVPNLPEKVDPNSVRLGDNPDAATTSLAVIGEGTWTVEVVDGKPVLKFEPLPDFKGIPSPVPLVAKDKTGQPATPGSVTIFPILTSIDEKGKIQHSTDVDPGDKGLPVEKLFPALDGKTIQTAVLEPVVVGDTTIEPNAEGNLVVPGKGTFSVAADGVVTFTPEDDFVGTAPTVTVVATADDGTKAKAKYTPTVVPKLVPGEEFGVPGAPVDVSVPPLPDAADPGTFGFIDPNDPDGDPVKTLVVPGEGTWTVENNVAKFVPESTFKKVPSPVVVGAKTKDGNKVTPSTLTVFPVLTSVDEQGKPQLSTDDGPGDKTLPIGDQFPTLGGKKPASAVLEPVVVGDTTIEPNAEGNLVVPGKGTFSVAADGVVTFTPEDDFVGTAPTVTVVATADDGTKAKAKYTPTVVPKLVPGEEFGVPGAPVDVPVPPLPDAADPGTFGFIDPNDPDGDPVKKLVVPGEGTWTVENNVAKFVPESTFKKVPSPVVVGAKTKDGNKVTPSTLTVFPVLTSVDEQGKPQLSTDDGPGDKTLPIGDQFPTLKGKQIESTVFESVVVGGETIAPNAEGNLVVPGKGTFSVAADGVVTFTPETDFLGVAPAVTVVATTADGVMAKAKYTPTVVPPLAPAEEFAIPGTTIESVKIPDLPKTADPATLGFIDPANPTGDPVKKLVVPGEGTWTVNPDNTVKFEPESSFKGIPAPVHIGAKTTNGDPIKTSTVTIFPLLTSVDKLGKDQSSVDDGVGDKTLPLVDQFPALKDKEYTVTLEGADNDGNVVIPGTGKFIVNTETKVVEFIPDDGFVGTAPTVTIIATAEDGTVVKAKYTPTVLPKDPGLIEKIIPFTPLLLIPLLGGIAGSSSTPVVPGSSTPDQPAQPGQPAAPAQKGVAKKGIAKSESAPVKGVVKANGLANTGVSGVTAALALAVMAMIAGLGVLVLRRKKDSE